MVSHLVQGLALLLSIAVPVGQDRGEPVHQAQMEARIRAAPRPVTGSDGRRHLAYELQVTSHYAGDAPLRLTRLAIFAGDARTPLATLEGAALRARLGARAADEAPQDGIPIADGTSRTFFLWLALPPGAPPATLRHQLSFRADKGAIQRADDVRTPVIAAAPVRIGPPLRGGRWLAVEGPGNHLSHHWGSMVAIDGMLSIPQRYAIDWFGLDGGNHSIRGVHASPAATMDADWIGYGRDVLAVRDGVVVDARDGIPNGTPLAPQQVPDDLTARTLYGNFVVLRIAPGVYAHYAHLRAGSVRVRPGQRVRRGMVIGRLGQTGSAGAPHLHFHVSDRPGFERSEGLPFVIDRFTLLGEARIEDSFDSAVPVPVRAAGARMRRDALPLDGSITAFP
ncbi:MAG: M23 family metallopeptidase [Sphingomonas sp.]|uniref:M23 family metallopeptidase n=1 Tax=Sphingomonas sp. TaxID=28214 RepID=UPI0025DE081A|nr:M23 family metallopeptidase [Sphingomonas sp.]MBQ1496920.1 M23 family metallopeptidase [Sphingomonas sp.]